MMRIIRERIFHSPELSFKEKLEKLENINRMEKELDEIVKPKSEERVPQFVRYIVCLRPTEQA